MLEPDLGQNWFEPPRADPLLHRRDSQARAIDLNLHDVPHGHARQMQKRVIQWNRTAVSNPADFLDQWHMQPFPCRGAGLPPRLSIHRNYIVSVLNP